MESPGAAPFTDFTPGGAGLHADGRSSSMDLERSDSRGLSRPLTSATRRGGSLGARCRRRISVPVVVAACVSAVAAAVYFGFLDKSAPPAPPSPGPPDDDGRRWLQPWERSLNLGTVDFGKVSTTNATAAAHFGLGLAVLHSFWYALAASEFLAAQEGDRCFRMAIGFEALSYAQPLWDNLYWADGRDAVARLREQAVDPACAGSVANETPREKAWLAAVEKVWDGPEGDRSPARWAANVRAWNVAMAGIIRDYPDDIDAKAFLALSYLGIGALEPEDCDEACAAAAVQAARDTLGPLQQSGHPGVLHYTLHAYDFPAPPVGTMPGPVDWNVPILAGDNYMQMVSSACHALHMPSHILMRVGWWNRSHVSNTVSIQAAEAYCTSRFGGDPGDLRGPGQDFLACDEDNLYHSLEYLANDFEQLGRVRDANAALERMQGVVSVAEHAPMCANGTLPSSWGFNGTTQSCVAKFERWEFRMRARSVLEAAARAPLDQWTSTWASMLDKTTWHPLPHNKHFGEDANWSPISEAGLLMAHAGALAFQPDATPASITKAVGDATDRLDALSQSAQGAQLTKLSETMEFFADFTRAVGAFALGDDTATAEHMASAMNRQDLLTAEMSAADPTLLFIPTWESFATMQLARPSLAAAVRKGAAGPGGATNLTAEALFNKTLVVRPGRAASLLGAARATADAQLKRHLYTVLMVQWGDADRDLAVWPEVCAGAAGGVPPPTEGGGDANDAALLRRRFAW